MGFLSSGTALIPADTVNDAITDGGAAYYSTIAASFVTLIIVGYGITAGKWGFGWIFGKRKSVIR